MISSWYLRITFFDFLKGMTFGFTFSSFIAALVFLFFGAYDNISNCLLIEADDLLEGSSLESPERSDLVIMSNVFVLFIGQRRLPEVECRISWNCHFGAGIRILNFMADYNSQQNTKATVSITE